MNPPRFRAGDLIEVIRGRIYPQFIGRRLILSGRPRVWSPSVWAWPSPWSEEVGILPPDLLVIEEYCMRKIRPTDEANCVVSWDECPWRPRETEPA